MPSTNGLFSKIGATQDLHITKSVDSGFSCLQAVKNGNAMTESPTQFGQNTPILNLKFPSIFFQLHLPNDRLLDHRLYIDNRFAQ